MTKPIEELLPETIRLELVRWLADAPGTTASDINRGEGAHGCCADFRSDIYERLGGVREAYALGLYDVGIDSFMECDDDGECNAFDVGLLGKHWPQVVPPAGMSWEDLDQMALVCGFSAGTHEWIVLNNRHFDAETPDGVDNFFDLPYFQRVVESYRAEVLQASPTP